jgi:hypothetical protein
MRFTGMVLVCLTLGFVSPVAAGELKYEVLNFGSNKQQQPGTNQWNFYAVAFVGNIATGQVFACAAKISWHTHESTNPTLDNNSIVKCVKPSLIAGADPLGHGTYNFVGHLTFLGQNQPDVTMAIRQEDKKIFICPFPGGITTQGILDAISPGAFCVSGEIPD